MKLNSTQLKNVQKSQARLLALAIAVAAAFTGIYSIEGDASVSASLVTSLPPAKAQVFPMQQSMATIQASQVDKTRKAIPKQAPKFKVVSRFTASISAYTSRVEETDDSPWYTANGTWCTEGVAAGPYNLPFGTKFRIPSLFGDRVFVIQDRMAATSGRVDIWMRSYNDAIQFGRRTATVEVLG